MSPLAFEQSEWNAARSAAEHAATRLRLPFLRGSIGVGGVTASGAGSSLDFKDHRPYLPGDDPRYINWNAYARTGNWILKVFHQEASPALDVLVDFSRSMFLDAAKRTRVAELLCFVLECGLRSGASLRLHLWRGGKIEWLAVESAMAGQIPPPDAVDSKHAGAPDLAQIPVRPGALRVVLTDLLYPCTGSEMLHPLVRDRGRGLLLAPYCAAEADPDWIGQFEFRDVERGTVRVQRVDRALLRRYRETYARHFNFWRESASRSGIAMARVSAEGVLLEALRVEGLAGGALELRG